MEGGNPEGLGFIPALFPPTIPPPLLSPPTTHTHTQKKPPPGQHATGADLRAPLLPTHTSTYAPFTPTTTCTATILPQPRPVSRSNTYLCMNTHAHTHTQSSSWPAVARLVDLCALHCRWYLPKTPIFRLITVSFFSFFLCFLFPLPIVFSPHLSLYQPLVCVFLYLSPSLSFFFPVPFLFINPSPKPLKVSEHPIVSLCIFLTYFIILYITSPTSFSVH